jgi:putative spermidine/putrescine transport system ATP-binding protein
MKVMIPEGSEAVTAREAPMLSLTGLTKHFHDVAAVAGLDLEIQEGEQIALLGPSGCGKTTTLRMIAGFERPTSGLIHLAGRDITSLPPERRECGMVFQNYALFPHLTVQQNVSFGLEMRGVEVRDQRRRVETILDRVGLKGLDRRYPRQLSGGQQQRAALARALVMNPKVLLLDEPLANLDAKLREEMRFYIRSLQREFKTTSIYVTHDQAEALVLADRIVVMIDGALQQVGEPHEIYERPASVQVADFIGLSNLIPATVARVSEKSADYQTEVGKLTGIARQGLAVGSQAWLSVRPEHFSISRGDQAQRDSTALNSLQGTVKDSAFLGNLMDYRIDVGAGVLLRAQGSPGDAAAIGERVRLTFASGDAWPLPKGGDDRG